MCHIATDEALDYPKLQYIEGYKESFQSFFFTRYIGFINKFLNFDFHSFKFSFFLQNFCI